MIHAPGLSGTPRSGHDLERRDERLLDRLLGEVEVAEDADERRDGPPLFLAEQAVDDGVRIDGRRQVLGRLRVSVQRGRPIRSQSARGPDGLGGRAHVARVLPDRPDLDRAVLGAGDLRRELDRLVEVLGLDEVEAAEGFLRLGERAVGRDRLAVPDPDGRRARVGWSASPACKMPRSRSSLVNAS